MVKEVRRDIEECHHQETPLQFNFQIYIFNGELNQSTFKNHTNNLRKNRWYKERLQTLSKDTGEEELVLQHLAI